MEPAFNQSHSEGDSNERLFIGGQPNPEMAGIALRGQVSGSDPMHDRIDAAAKILSRPVQYVDARGVEHEIIAASPVRADGASAYVSTSAKDVGSHVAISICFHIRTAQARETAAEIESYNPYFGCDVRSLEWMGNSAVLIYREKHNTYVAVCDDEGLPRFVQIADAWVLKNDLLAYWKYKEVEVQRLRLPMLEALEPITEAAAALADLCPPKHW